MFVGSATRLNVSYTLTLSIGNTVDMKANVFHL